jgi:hypothetical protein
MRTADDERELAVETYGYFADRDPLTRAVMDRMLAGVSTRGFAGVGEPVDSDVADASSATSKSTVSVLFIERTRTAGRSHEPAARRHAPGGDDARRPRDRRPLPRRRARDHHRRRQGSARALGRLDRDASLARLLLTDLIDSGLDPSRRSCS